MSGAPVKILEQATFRESNELRRAKLVDLAFEQGQHSAANQGIATVIYRHDHKKRLDRD